MQIVATNSNYLGRVSMDRDLLFETDPSGSTFAVYFFHLETLFSKFFGIYSPPPTDMMNRSRITAHLILSMS